MTTQKQKYTELRGFGDHAIAQEPGLVDVEIETAIYWSRGDGGKATIMSREPAIIRALKDLPFFKPLEIHAVGDGALTIVYASGKIPVGAVSVKNPRRSNSVARVISLTSRGKVANKAFPVVSSARAGGKKPAGRAVSA